MTKNEAMLAYVQQCPDIRRLYFTTAEMTPDAVQITASSVETSAQAAYVDGSRLRYLDYSLIWFRPLAVVPVLNPATGAYNQAVAELDNIQSIIDWVEAQNDAQNLPDFGDGFVVDSVRCLQAVPQLLGIDNNYSPPMARYTFTLRVEFLDITRCNN